MAGDLRRLGERISELRGTTPRNVVAHRAGISGAYLHQVERAAVNKTTGEPSKPSIPVVRSIAFALGNVQASELLELAGYEEDVIAYDRMRERRAALPVAPSVPVTLTSSAAVEELRRLLALVEDSEEQPGDQSGASERRLRPVGPSTRHIDTQGTEELG